MIWSSLWKRKKYNNRLNHHKQYLLLVRMNINLLCLCLRRLIILDWDCLSLPFSDISTTWKLILIIVQRRWSKNIKPHSDKAYVDILIILLLCWLKKSIRNKIHLIRSCLVLLIIIIVYWLVLHLGLNDLLDRVDTTGSQSLCLIWKERANLM